jgi:sec-independent protein translocase protein TatA
MFTGMLTPGHLMLVLVVVLMLFGTKRLPEVGRSLGAGLRDFKQSLDGRDEPDRIDQP